MGPLNSDERRSSFFLFLLFFIISMLLVSVTAFFGMEVPTVENKLMGQQIAVLQKDKADLQRFATKMSETVGYLNTVNNPGIQNADIYDSKIAANLDTLTRQIGSDTSARGKMLVDIVSSLQSLKVAKKSLRENGNNSKSASELENELSRAKADLVACQTAVASLSQKK